MSSFFTYKRLPSPFVSLLPHLVYCPTYSLFFHVSPILTTLPTTPFTSCLLPSHSPFTLYTFSPLTFLPMTSIYHYSHHSIYSFITLAACLPPPYSPFTFPSINQSFLISLFLANCASHLFTPSFISFSTPSSQTACLFFPFSFLPPLFLIHCLISSHLSLTSIPRPPPPPHVLPLPFSFFLICMVNNFSTGSTKETKKRHYEVIAAWEASRRIKGLRRVLDPLFMKERTFYARN